MNEAWMQKWEEVKDRLISPVDIETYFTADEIMDQKMEVMEIGNVSLPSGKVIVRDPLVYLNTREKPYFVDVPKGNFPVKIAVAKLEDWGNRYAAVKVEFTKEKAVVYREALIGEEELGDSEEEDYFGFVVDAGLACITDTQIVPYVDQFISELDVENIYDDYFAELFAKNYKENPTNQRDLGDWINWKVPETEYHIPIFASGLGDGVYPVYFGYDANEEICSLYIHFIDIEMELSEVEEDDDDEDEISDQPDNFVFLK
ncbi:DUF4241 domain-containing protein [Chryseobacterium sp. WG14]|uniref:DUF4241 domain-containing protein n=1 Tax=unclassified Chryseobacterium TaxID=2593645 RepID=UPI00211EBD62|nr:MULTISPECIES: DUF4241 domain-containing protein [unclassified Chryseobacterium]MCQ9637465.1 DUF4241 domain-containing protein [Chryseobacterium sp. WG23]MCQ9641882.1 DUF4241 domain-containing protein [Chryseobacterium sp. WG14]